MAYLIIDRKLFIISILNLFLAYKIYDYIKASEKKIIRIPIAMNTSNEYIYQTLITLTSLSENSNKDNIYDINILIPKNFFIDYRLKILQFELKYKNINIILIESEEPYVKFENYNSKFSKFFLHLLIPGYDKIIYLNYNALILSDLEELFNINLEENYFSGFLSNDNISLYNNFNISLNKSINTDILLINTKKLKEDNKIGDFKKIYNKYKDKNLNEKLMINIIFYNNTGILPSKYGMPNFDNVDDGLNYNEKILDICKYEKEEFISSFYEPIIIDLLICKPWEKGKKCKQSDAWWYYAKKNVYFNEIKEKYAFLFE